MASARRGGCWCSLSPEESTTSFFVDGAMEDDDPETVRGGATIRRKIQTPRLASRTSRWRQTCPSRGLEEERIADAAVSGEKRRCEVAVCGEEMGLAGVAYLLK